MIPAQQQKAAADFARRWQEKIDEETEAQGKLDEKKYSETFWIDLLQSVYGMSHVANNIEFEKQVKIPKPSGSGKQTCFIDGYISRTNVIIEQKSSNKNLNTPYKQSDNTFLTAYGQAERYGQNLSHAERPRWIVTCNFKEFHVHDMNDIGGMPDVVSLEDFGNDPRLLQILTDAESPHIRKDMKLSVEAGGIVAEIYNALREQYLDPDSRDSQHSLNVLCVRLVFCLYADSAGIFGQYGMFSSYLGAHRHNARSALIELFRILDQTEEQRDKYLPTTDPALAAFPYVNGGLFRLEAEIPTITPGIVELILDKAGDFDWKGITPTIFGAIFESTLNPQTRRAGGMHYTSVDNIRKVIQPLFLGDLRKELDDILHKYTSAQGRRKHLNEFRNKLASLTFFDPACGSGNFLTETYLSLRRMENIAIGALNEGQMAWAEADPIRVSIEQFHGIEINDFAVSVAQTAMWIAESQMLQETEALLSMNIDYLPLTTAAHIVEGNALRIDWNEIVPNAEVDYIIGNPPFLGYSLQNREQKADLQAVFVDSEGKPLPRSGKIDYVAGWFYKAAQYMYGTSARAALVSTNSITMGEQVALIWKPLRRQFGTEIDFAWRTFRWGNEAANQAQVHVVIIGFSDAASGVRERTLFFSDGTAQRVSSISPYLVEGEPICVISRDEPFGDVPSMVAGGKPADGGHLILTDDEKNELLKAEPQAEPFLRPFLMGKDFIDRKPRWCLWLVDADPSLLKKSPRVLQRVEKVRDFRLMSKKAATRKKAEMPALFDEVRISDTRYIAVPKVSSERRSYIPMDYLDPAIVPGDKLFVLENASLYHFGILTSSVHMAWMRTVAGRLKSDYSYSNTIVYNNFPWPAPTAAQKAKIEQTARAILDARALHPDASLADLYDEATMPPELRKAHQDNDRAVMEAYGFREKGRWLTEPEIVARLMQMYAELTQR